MKKWIFMLLLAGSIQGVYAQKTEKKDKFNPNTPLFEELTDVKKKTDKFNLYLNMQGRSDVFFAFVLVLTYITPSLTTISSGS